MRVLGGREDRHQPGVEQEVISKYEQEPEFRNFIKNLLRCRSLASLDDQKGAEREEEEKTARPEKQNDDIKPRVVGRGGGGGPGEKRRNHQARLSEGGRREERSGRGEPGPGDSTGVSCYSVTTDRKWSIKCLAAPVNLEIFIISRTDT